MSFTNSEKEKSSGVKSQERRGQEISPSLTPFSLWWRTLLCVMFLWEEFSSQVVHHFTSQSFSCFSGQGVSWSFCRKRVTHSLAPLFTWFDYFLWRFVKVIFIVRNCKMWDAWQNCQRCRGWNPWNARKFLAGNSLVLMFHANNVAHIEVCWTLNDTLWVPVYLQYTLWLQIQNVLFYYFLRLNTV